MEILNARYVEITKAYQALTDEDVRNNYIQYGHPDGKQSMSFGIALPKFIVSEGNGKYVVLFYTLLLGVLLPYLVGSWWYGIQRTSKEGVLVESANNLFREYKEDLKEDGIVTALSTAKEYKNLLKGDKTDKGLAKLESKIADIIPPEEKAKLEELDDSTRRKALGLLWAYLGRVDLDDAALNRAKFQVGPIGQSLIRSFTAISLAYGNAAPIIASYIANQHIVQAMLPKSSPLLQLPFFTPAVAKAVDGDSKVHSTVQQFADRPDDERRQLVVGDGLLTESQYSKAMSVARELPHLRVAKAFFKVPGERFITPSSLVSLVVKGRVVPPGCEKVPEIDSLDLEDMDPAEDDLEAITGRKKKVKKADGRWVSVEDTKVNPTITTAPYFARDHMPKWFVFLTDAKSGKIAVPPFSFTQFEEPIFDGEGKPTFNMQTLKAQFAAPPQPGHYTFAMHLICDSYVGMDTKMEVTLVVENASKAAAMTAEDDISDPEEGEFSRSVPVFHSQSSLRFANGVCRFHRWADERAEGRQREEEPRARRIGRRERHGRSGRRHQRYQHGHGGRVVEPRPRKLTLMFCSFRFPDLGFAGISGLLRVTGASSNSAAGTWDRQGGPVVVVGSSFCELRPRKMGVGMKSGV